MKHHQHSCTGQWCASITKIIYKKKGFIVVYTRTVRSMRKRFTKQNKKKGIYHEGLYKWFTILHTHKKKRNWVASPPIRRNKVKYKMFSSVLSRCGTGNLETCTHIISRPKDSFIHFCCQNLLLLLLLLLLLFLWGYLTLGRHCKGLWTAHPHKPQHVLAVLVALCGWRKPWQWEWLGITMFPLVSYILIYLFFPEILWWAPNSPST